MADKAECPACRSYSSSIHRAVQGGEACPHCGLSHSALTKILVLQTSRANEELVAKYEAALIRADRAEREASLLRTQLLRIQELANKAPEAFESPF